MTSKSDADVEKILLAMVDTRNKRDEAIAEFKKLRMELTRASIQGRVQVAPEDILKIDAGHLLSW